MCRSHSLYFANESDQHYRIKIIWFHVLIIVSNFVFYGHENWSFKSKYTDRHGGCFKPCAVDNTWKVRIILEK